MNPTEEVTSIDNGDAQISDNSQIIDNEEICNTSDIENNPHMHDTSDIFTFLEDIEPPSLLGSSYDSYLMQNSTPNSACDKIHQEHLVSINSSYEKNRSYLLIDSVNDHQTNFNENSKQLHSDANQIVNIISKMSDTSKDITETMSSVSDNKNNVTNPADCSSFSFETDLVGIIKLLKQAGSSTNTDEQQSFFGLDKISDSILISCISRDESVFLPNDSIEESSPVKCAKIGESFVVSDNTTKKAINNTTFEAVTPIIETVKPVVEMVKPIVETVAPPVETVAPPVETVKEQNTTVIITKNPDNEKEQNNTVIITKNPDNEKEQNNTVFIASDPDHEKEQNATVIICSEPDHENIVKLPHIKDILINTTFEGLPNRLLKMNRTFDKSSKDEVKESDKPENITVVLDCANETLCLPTNNSEEICPEDLNNGVFLMRGKETSLMDMEASDLISVLSQVNTSKNISKRHSLQNKAKDSPSSKNRRLSLNTKENLLKRGIKANDNKLQKKIDRNPFSTLNLFKGKLRGTGLKNSDEKKGPMRATYRPESNLLEDSETSIYKSRAVSSPCAGSNVKRGSKSDSENSVPPLPSFGSVSTIDSDRPSTPDLGMGNTPEVFRRKDSSSMVTSTPAMKCEGSHGQMSMLRMTDVPTPIAAPNTTRPLRGVNEGFSETVCDEVQSNAEGDQIIEKKPVMLKCCEDDSKMMKISNVRHKNATILNKSNRQNAPVTNSTPTNKSLKMNNPKENINPVTAKVRSNISGLPLKGRILNPRKSKTPTIQTNPAKPLTSAGKLCTVTNNKIAGVRPVKKSLEPRLEKITVAPKIENPVNKSQPRRSVAIIGKPKIQSTRRSISYKPNNVNGSKQVNNRVSLPKKSINDINTGETRVKNTVHSDASKKCSVIPRPTFKAK